MHECHHYDATYTRRDFLTRTTLGLGAATLASLMTPAGARATSPGDEPDPGILGSTHFPAKVKRVIYLLQSGGPIPVGPVRLQASPSAASWGRIASVRKRHAAADRHDGGPKELPYGPVAVHL